MKEVDQIPDEIKSLSAVEIRKMFCDYFLENKELPHTYWPSSPVVLPSDPTLLFANAGMNQFKTIFTGEADSNSEFGKLQRVVNSQKCIRAGGKHNDLDDVGKDVYHHTFFEMLGSWSFGNYFKKEAIEMAWTVLTQVFKIPKSRLYVTYYGGDERQPNVGPDLECRDLWLKVGVPEDRIIPFDMKDNFWEMGDVGPCGPCTEIHYDRIGGRDVPELVNIDDPNVLEIWNNVFIQYYRDSTGKLTKLPRGSVDTGMGFERLVSVIQDVPSNYDTDLFQPLFKVIKEHSGMITEYSGKVGKDDIEGIDTAYRVIADHIRTVSIAISDGCYPSNEHRGYIIRRVLRRAIRFGRKYLNAPKEPWLYKCTEPVLECFKDVYSNIATNYKSIQDTIKEEEIGFGKTLEKGVIFFNKQAAIAKKSDSSNNKSIITGDVAFNLHTVCGFPVDLVQIMAEEEGMTVDMDGYDRAMRRHKKLSENVNFKGGKPFVIKPDQLEHLSKALGVSVTVEEGKYDWLPGTGEGITQSVIVKAIFDVDSSSFLTELTDKKSVGIVLDKTNFYAESGGQIGDVGTLICNNGAHFEVIDTKVFGEYIFHIGKFKEDNCCVKVGETVTTNVDYKIRADSAKNHTGTHVLNYALRTVLDKNCDQKGSLVDNDKLRFDFQYDAGLTSEQVRKVELIVNEQIELNFNVNVDNVPLEDAIKVNGLRAVAGDSYPNPVRMVAIGCPITDTLEKPDGDNAVNHSVEFCGGTHLHSTGEMIKMVIITEEALAKGIRRIVSYTGQSAVDAINYGQEFLKRIEQLEKLSSLSEMEPLLVTLRNTIQKEKEHFGLVTRKEATERIEAVGKKVLTLQKERSKGLLKVAEEIGDQIRKDIEEKQLKYYIFDDVHYNSGTPSRLECDSKAMDSIIKRVFGKKLNDPIAVPLMIISSTGGHTVSFQIQVPKTVSSTISAIEWGNVIANVLEGKTGGKNEVARGTIKELQLEDDSPNLCELADNFAKKLLN